jgi:hypothetical protein
MVYLPREETLQERRNDLGLVMLDEMDFTRPNNPGKTKRAYARIDDIPDEKIVQMARNLGIRSPGVALTVYGVSDFYSIAPDKVLKMYRENGYDKMMYILEKFSEAGKRKAILFDDLPEYERANLAADGLIPTDGRALESLLESSFQPLGSLDVDEMVEAAQEVSIANH